MRSRVVIVGGGIIGLSTGYYLAKRGVEVTILEANYLGYGATGRSFGAIKERWKDKHVTKLSIEGVKKHETLTGELNMNTLFRQEGCLTIALTDEEMESLKLDWKENQRIGVKCKFLSRDEINDRWPYINTSHIVGGCYDEREGIVHPLALIWGFQENLKRLGGEIGKFSRVKGIERINSKFKLLTEKGSLEAENVLVACSFSSKEILGKLGVNLPVKPVRKEVLVTEPMKPFLNPVIERTTNSLRVAQTMRGEVIGTINYLGEGTDIMESSLDFLKCFAREATKIISCLKSLKVLRQWTGVCDETPDNKPVIGETEIENLFVAYGFHEYGVTVAPVIGELMAKLIVEGKEDPLINPFKPERFS